MTARVLVLLLASGCGDEIVGEFSDAEVCNGIDDDGDGLRDEAAVDNAMCDDCRLEEVGGSSYWFCDTVPRTWPDARAFCMDHGADLAVADDVAENARFAAGIEGGRWLGGTDAASEGTWAWIDGSPFALVKWGMDQPDDFEGRQDCLRVIGGMYQAWPAEAWDDFDCEREHPFVCEAP